MCILHFKPAKESLVFGFLGGTIGQSGDVSQSARPTFLPGLSIRFG